MAFLIRYYLTVFGASATGAGAGFAAAGLVVVLATGLATGLAFLPKSFAKNFFIVLPPLESKR
jgi:hypothetical protein